MQIWNSHLQKNSSVAHKKKKKKKKRHWLQVLLRNKMTSTDLWSTLFHCLVGCSRKHRQHIYETADTALNMHTDVHTNSTDVVLSRLGPLIARCVWCWNRPVLRKASYPRVTNLSPTMTRADPGLMIQTAPGVLVCTPPRTKWYSF